MLSNTNYLNGLNIRIHVTYVHRGGFREGGNRRTPPPPPPLQLEKIRLFGVKSESKLINGVAGKTTGHVILI